jgi:hypothetical protein
MIGRDACQALLNAAALPIAIFDRENVVDADEWIAREKSIWPWSRGRIALGQTCAAMTVGGVHKTKALAESAMKSAPECKA